MDLKANRVDLVKREEGAWVDNIPDGGLLRIKTRGLNNKAYVRMFEKLNNAVPRKQRINGLAPEERTRIQNICLRDTCLLEWDGLTDGGVVVPFSKEKANELMADPECEAFQFAVLFAAMSVANAADDEIKDDVKN